MQRGFVLATTLVMLLLLSMMTLSALQNGMVELHMSMAMLHAYQQDAELSAGIDAGISVILHHDPTQPKPPCWLATVLDKPANQLGLAQWRGMQSCSGQFNHVQYHFMIETLRPVNKCLQYYRITSYLPNVGAHWQVATVLSVDQAGISDHTCQLDLAERQALPRWPTTVMLLSWYRLP